jgi:hypothetical protein
MEFVLAEGIKRNRQRREERTTKTQIRDRF